MNTDPQYASTSSILEDCDTMEKILSRNFWHFMSERRQLERDRRLVRDGAIIHPNWEDYGPYVTDSDGRLKSA